MKPAVGGRAVREAGAALDREQSDPALVIRLAEEYDALGKAAGVPEPVPVEHRVVHEDTPGSFPGMLTCSSRRSGWQVTFSMTPHIQRVSSGSGISLA